MTPVKIFTGQRFDLEAYKGTYPIVEWEFEVLNDDCSARDMDTSGGVFFKVLSKQGGKVLLNVEMTIAATSPGNFIYLSDDSQIVELRAPRTVWYECYSLEGSPEYGELLFYGNLEL